MSDNSRATEENETVLRPLESTSHRIDSIPEPSEKSCGCGSRTSSTVETVEAPFVYAIGHIEPRFSSLATQIEYLQAAGRSNTKGQTDLEVLKTVLSNKKNRYIAKQMCWILRVGGLETYILRPRDPADYEILIDSLRISPRDTDLDVVVGVKGPIASPETCNGLVLPIVGFDQVYSFDIDSLMKSLPKPEKVDAKRLVTSSEELFNRMIQVVNNKGVSDEHRALNYLSVRYSAIYAKSTEMHERDFSLLPKLFYPISRY